MGQYTIHPHKCKCFPKCKAVVNGKRKIYARGHAPTSRCDKERGKKIRKTLEKLRKAGVPIGTQKGYKQSEKQELSCVKPGSVE
jgi:hypothetical protein